ncbi:unnamed protein product, partial [Meganyctiphanes norvegica]
VSLEVGGATTRSQSRKLFFFRYFLVRYLSYLFEKGTSDAKVILDLLRSSDTWLPKLFVLPLTLTRSCKNVSYGKKWQGLGKVSKVSSIHDAIFNGLTAVNVVLDLHLFLSTLFANGPLGRLRLCHGGGFSVKKDSSSVRIFGGLFFFFTPVSPETHLVDL